MLGVSVPHYWIGMVLVIISSVQPGWRASRATPIRDAIPGAPRFGRTAAGLLVRARCGAGLPRYAVWPQDRPK
jgi:ABC-type dipeptide/oligopeptide/nickel transport system permease component